MTLVSVERPTWSKSRVSALAECRRKLRFSTDKSLAADPDVQQLRKIKNRHLWVGGIVHDRIAEILKMVRQGEAVPATDGFILQTRERMRKEFKLSKENADASAGRLFEHVYDRQIEAAVWQRHWSSVEKSLHWFLASNWLKRFSALGPECWKAVDEILDFDVNGIKAYVKIDCAIESGGKFFLMDWKTGAIRDEAADGLRVAALYAHEVWGADPEQIDAKAVSVIDGKTLSVPIDEEVLMETHLKIEEESARLEEEVSNAGELLKIPPPSSRMVCNSCSYQKLCFPKGM